MEDAQILALDQQFSLQPPPPDEMDEQVMLAILKGIDTPKEKKPLQCVTFKQPLPEYFRLKKICEFWQVVIHLTQVAPRGCGCGDFGCYLSQRVRGK